MFVLTYVLLKTVYVQRDVILMINVYMYKYIPFIIIY